MQNSTAKPGKQAVPGHQAPLGWNAMETGKGLWQDGDLRGAGLRELTGGQMTPETNNLENTSLQLLFFIATIV